jgi:hypothetical protein
VHDGELNATGRLFTVGLDLVRPRLEPGSIQRLVAASPRIVSQPKAIGSPPERPEPHLLHEEAEQGGRNSR